MAHIFLGRLSLVMAHDLLFPPPHPPSQFTFRVTPPPPSYRTGRGSEAAVEKP